MRYRRKRCLWCGRYFRPDRRAGDNQKCCGREDCRHKRKTKAQQRWVAANPGCFSGRYANTKAWRQEHPGYQRQWRRRGRHGSRDTRRDRPRKAIKIKELQRVGSEIQDMMDFQTNREYPCGDETERVGHGDVGNKAECGDGLGGPASVPSSTTRPQGREGAVGVHSHRRDQTAPGSGYGTSAQLPAAGRVQEISLRQAVMHRRGSDLLGGGR